MQPYEKLLQAALDEALAGATVITENRRASRQVRTACERQLRAGHDVWETPDVLPLDAWLQRAWQSCLLGGATALVLLNRVQQTALWDRLVAESCLDVANRTGTVAAAVDAWQLLHAYEIELSPTAFQARPETRAFYEWSQRYLSLCDANGWIDSARLTSELCQLLPAIVPLLRKRIVLYGFDDFTPQQQSLINSLKEHGIGISSLIATERDAAFDNSSCVASADSKSELYAAARWARARLQQNPAARIGVVAARLSELRADADLIFTEVLHPEAFVIPGIVERAFDLSLGPSLAAYPIINTALCAIQIALSTLPTHDAGVLIRSPYIAGGASEAGQRAMFDLFLRGQSGVELAATQVQRALGDEHNRSRCPELKRRFARLTATAESVRAALRPSQWGQVISELLQAIGWPGDDEGGRPLNSAEYQATEAWSDLISEFASLDVAMSPLGPVQMLVALKRLATDKIFKPENIGAPVQIMGMLEAAGSTFDDLWVCGLSDDVWPPRGNPSPFLPLSLQRAAGAPHCVPAQEFEFAETVTARLAQSASTVVFSWPKRQDDRALRRSPLLANLRTVEEEQIGGVAAPSWHELQRGVALEAFSSEQAPPLEPLDVHRGGTRVFELQSNCPFHAFLEMRLGAARMEEPESGIRAKDRGKVIESALELVWSHLRDHFTLTATAPAKLDEIIAASVDEAMTQLAATEQPWELRYRSLERQRLLKLINEWLELEKKREPFKVVEHQRQVEVSAGGIKVNGRIDRIDQTNDGGLVILDYKTGGGNYSAGQWRGDRPEHPQLQLYVTSQTLPVSAVAFAVVRTAKCALKGYGTRKEILAQGRDNAGKYFAPGDSFEQHITRWKDVLADIGRAYSAGVAAVDPQPERVCDYCHLAAACRVAEQEGLPRDAEAEGQNDEE